MTIRISCNGQPREVPQGTTLQGLLELLHMNGAIVVIEKNCTIIEKENYPRTLLAANDSIELIRFVGGG